MITGAAGFAQTPVELASAEPVSVEGRFFDRGKSVPAHRAASSLEVPGIAARLGDSRDLTLPAIAPDAASAPEGYAHFGKVAVGRVRDLPWDAGEGGEWVTLPDGRALWRLGIRATGARMLRVHFDKVHLGEGKLFLYSDPEQAQQFTGGGLFGDGEFWAGATAGERVQVEYMPADGLRAETLPFRIAGITHIWEDMAAPLTPEGPLALAPRGAPEAGGSTLSLAKAGPGREVAACHLDVSCFPEWRQAASGVARFLFVDGPVVSACSGALINSRSNSGKPLFLTADHCVSSDTVARTVEANFFYETAACGGDAPDFSKVENVLGASYLDSDNVPYGDYSLLQLSAAPAKAFFFGWTTTEPELGAKLVGIHHPAASFKRISFGERVKDEGIVVGGELQAEYAPGDKYYAVHLTEGKAQGGSSGSPLINENRQVVGILSAGPSYSPIPEEQDRLLCEAPRLVVYYGRLVAGYAALEPWLEDLRSARIAFPRPGATLPADKVDFRWSAGVGAREYRILVGRSLGSSEILDRSTGIATNAAVDNLPRDGRAVYVRLLTRLDSGWEAADATFIADSGDRVEAATLVSPAANSTITQSRVEFRWTEGVKVDEYRLEVGTSLGGGDIFGANTGKKTSATVENIALDGAPLHARLWSYVGGEWLKRDYVIGRADANRKTVVLSIANRLAAAVIIEVNERSVASIAAGVTEPVAVPRGASVRWTALQPARPDTGGRLGEAFGDTIAVPEDRGAADVEITNVVKGQAWYAPTVTNNTRLPKLLEVNGVRLHLTLGRGQTLPLGYYRWSPEASVRGYSDIAGYAGTVDILRGFQESMAPGSGAVALEFR
ncbi:MAG: trypsin-like peptidase domain-containing protein [Bryobacteraceae bacterium]